MIHWIEAAGFIVGMGLAALLVVFPRFGPRSRHLLYFILPACLSAAAHGFGTDITGLSPKDSLRLSFALIILAAAGGYIAGCNLNQKAKHLSSNSSA